MNPDKFLATAPGQVIQAGKGTSAYWAYVPYPLPPALEWTLPLVSALADAERQLSRLAELSNHLPSPYWLVRPFIRREAVVSSRIEGTHASLTDLYTYETTQLSFFEPSPDVQEVYNYVQALDYGLERLNTLPLSLRLIRELHARLMRGVCGEQMTPGEFRRSQNWIGPAGSTINSAPYVPPPVDEMHLALGQLERFINQPSELPALARAGLIHYQFEAIHPFLDGNGRVGRLLVTLLLCAWDLLPQPLLYLSAYFEANRLEYYDRLLAVSQRRAWENWLTFFLIGVSSQAQDAVLRIQKIETLRQSYQEQLQGERAAKGLIQALDVLFERPILSIQQVAETLAVPYPTARRYMLRLATLGIVQEVTGHQRNRIYRAEAILKAIEAPLE